MLPLRKLAGEGPSLMSTDLANLLWCRKCGALWKDHGERCVTWIVPLRIAKPTFRHNLDEYDNLPVTYWPARGVRRRFEDEIEEEDSSNDPK